MRLERVEIENYRAIEKLKLRLDPRLTVLHGANGDGKTSVLSAIATGLGGIARWLPDVSSIGFLDTDLRGLRPLRVALKADDGTEWERRRRGRRRTIAARRLKDAIEAIVAADRDGGEPLDLPIVAFYDTDRAVIDAPRRRRGFKTSFPRYAALQDALSRRTDFKEFFKWFYVLENEALRELSRRDRNYQLPELQAVRTAIERIVPGVSNPRVMFRPLRFVVSVVPGVGMAEHPESDRSRRQPGCGAGAADVPEDLELDQLSGGYLIMLALAADLARRMAQGNPHLDDPLQSEAVVLIDEVDLHLHPAWQQRVLPDLTRTFPNAQFVVSTHSPQVLTTVEPERIVRLYRDDDDDRVRAGHEVGPTYGAEASGVLETIMEVRERPAGNVFVETLKKYMALVDEGKGEREEARALRRDLEALSPEDYGLYRADAEMRRQRVMDRLGKPR